MRREASVLSANDAYAPWSVLPLATRKDARALLVAVWSETVDRNEARALVAAAWSRAVARRAVIVVVTARRDASALTCGGKALAKGRTSADPACVCGIDGAATL